MGPLGEWLWASVHGGSAYIYLIMNKSIRTAALRPFLGSKGTTAKSAVTVTANVSSTRKNQALSSKTNVTKTVKAFAANTRHK
ncbi:hypothetical protein L596_026670 [Steinernema carpocapsae]|uniref:Uncharacterized protein n=1 Tax=Steinernema carpocapsae TaxID=34508 RepID=A0A4U5M217_STECR|nr:hypothetical protein L596_026670 [Steinernema carpocapsae]